MTRNSSRIVIFCLAAAIASLPCAATSYAPVPMKKLFDDADAVAFVRIVRGSTEGFETALYVAQVVEPVKGLARGDRVHFGPYIGGSLGGEYLVFLTRSDRLVGSLCVGNCGSSLGVETSAVFYNVMFVGFGSMEVAFTCPFETCTYCVDVPVSHAPLPAAIRAAPYDDPRSRVGEHAWIKKTDLSEHLRALASESTRKPAKFGTKRLPNR